MTSLSDPSDVARGTVIIGQRTIELTGICRQLLTSDLGCDDLFEVAIQRLSEAAAELALRACNIERAVKLLAFSMDRSPTGGGPPTLPQNLVAVVDEAAIAIWCYGLLHEMGHLEWDPRVIHPAATEERILTHLRYANENWQTQDVSKYCDPLKRAVEQRNISIVGIDQLRAEMEADLFAADALQQVMLEATERTGRELDFEALYREARVAHQIVVILDRLQRTTALRLPTVQEEVAVIREAAIEAMLSPLAATTRGLAQREFFSAFRAECIGKKTGRTLNRCLLNEQVAFVESCIAPLGSQFKVVDKALTDITMFILKEEVNLDVRDAVRRISDELKRDLGKHQIIGRFVELAEQVDVPNDIPLALRGQLERTSGGGVIDNLTFKSVVGAPIPPPWM
jgi:hypothetical protein